VIKIREAPTLSKRRANQARDKHRAEGEGGKSEKNLCGSNPEQEKEGTKEDLPHLS